MIRVEVVAKTQAAAEELADALRDEGLVEVAAARALGSGSYRPFLGAGKGPVDVVIAWQVTVPPLPAGGPAVVLITGHGGVRRSGSVRAWLHAGASPLEIASAAVAAHAGLYVLHGDQLAAGLDREVSELEQLTPRELAVLRMMADGSSNKEIALELAISVNTAKFHVAQVLAKLQVRSRTEAVRTGIQRGLVLL